MRAEASGRESKMVLILRGELRLTAGKAAVQAAHGAVMLAEVARERQPALAAAWRRSGQRKIALTVETLEEMLSIERKAKSARIPCLWVEDAGLTEVPAGTKTCLALGPAYASELDPITGNLPLL